MEFSALQLAYVVPFVAAAVVCVAAVAPARRIEDADTRAGLIGLLLLSAAWAAFEGAQIVVGDLGVGTAMYVAGLTVGFGTVFAWLYFASAYTGRSYHQRTDTRLAGAGLYLGVVVLKLTNPIHGWYYEVSIAASPFPHVVVGYGPLNWIVLGVAYLLSAVGFVWLIRFFSESPWNTRTLALLAGLTILPVAVTLAGRVTTPSVVLALNYEPLGVAAFAIGTLFVVLDSFRATLGEYGGAIDDISDAVIVVSDDGVVRRSNATAREAFPALMDATGGALDTVLPGLAEARASPRRIHSVGDRDWLVRESPVTLGPHAFGVALLLTDVTELRRQQAELSRQNQQLERLSEAITHEIRNGLAIADGHLDLAERSLSNVSGTTTDTSETTTDTSETTTDTSETTADASGPASDTTGDAASEPVTVERGTIADVEEAVTTARDGIDRTRRIVDDLTTLTRFGQTVRPAEYADCSLRACATTAFENTGVAVAVDGDARVEAHPGRLAYLFERAASFAVANDATAVTVSPTDDGFTVTDDGESVAPADADGLFAYGDAVPDAETGMLLPVVGTLARVHGWRVDPDTDYADGVRYTIRDASVSLAADEAADSTTDDSRATGL